MKIQTADLAGDALNWAVAKCEGVPVEAELYSWEIGKVVCQYTEDWALAGPIMDREFMYTNPAAPYWEASIYSDEGDQISGVGETRLIAAMRCYVASKMGYEIEIPEDLAEQNTTRRMTL